ncbi:MAG: DUF5663 domain-containing protein [Candidatus Saccharibacteria bacterium]|nr:DUF5663 domain-containing protein [Candidatus Saccharibacteria bacterium]
MTADQILEALGLSHADDAVKQRTLHKVMMAVETRFAAMIDDILTVEQMDEFAALPQDDVEAIQEWLKATVPAASELYTAALQDYVAELADKLNRLV